MDERDRERYRLPGELSYLGEKINLLLNSIYCETIFDKKMRGDILVYIFIRASVFVMTRNKEVRYEVLPPISIRLKVNINIVYGRLLKMMTWLKHLSAVQGSSSKKRDHSGQLGFFLGLLNI